MHSVLQTNREYLQRGERISLEPEALSVQGERGEQVGGEGETNGAEERAVSEASVRQQDLEAAGGGERAGGTQAVQALAAFHDSIFGSRGWGKLDWQLQVTIATVDTDHCRPASRLLALVCWCRARSFLCL